MTADIRKFIENKADLVGIFGETKITSWTLAVPYWDNPDLTKHADAKRKEVLDAELPYVSPHFNVRIAQETDFAEEAAKIIAYDHTIVRIDIESAPAGVISAWIETHNELINTLKAKVQDMGVCTSEADVQVRALQIAQFYIDGANVLDNLKTTLIPKSMNKL